MKVLSDYRFREKNEINKNKTKLKKVSLSLFLYFLAFQGNGPLTGMFQNCYQPVVKYKIIFGTISKNITPKND